MAKKKDIGLTVYPLTSKRITPVIPNLKSEYCLMVDLVSGDCFIYNEQLWIIGDNSASVNLETGEMMDAAEIMVLPVNIEIKWSKKNGK